MRHILLFLILIVLVLGTGCNNEIIDNAADFEFVTADKETNNINLIVTVRYRLKSRLEDKLSKKYNNHYKDSLLLPAISSISKKVLKDYSAGEIYNYKRNEIEERLAEQTKTTLAEYDLELTDFLIRSVGLSDTLMARFQKEHVVRFENAFNKCSKEVKGVITKMRDSIIFYEFVIESKTYEGVLNPGETGDNVSSGDTIIIEYACENPAFYRVKK